MMQGQMSIFDLDQEEHTSICKDCFYECKGVCVCWHSRYEDMRIPIKGCDLFDGVTGGIDLARLREGG